jgi:hypothetical protein
MTARIRQQQFITDSGIVESLNQVSTTPTRFATTSPWIQNNTYLRHIDAPLHISVFYKKWIIRLYTGEPQSATTKPHATKQSSNALYAW